VRELERAPATGNGLAGVDVDQLAKLASEVHGASVLVAAIAVADGKLLLDVVDRLKNKLGDAAIVLAASGEDRVDIVASVAPALVARGVRAGEIVKVAAGAVGGGGGGRDTLARAGGRDPERLPEAIEAARAAIEAALVGNQ
jgi:alanyl-tRNA synthetase